MNEMQQNS